MVFWANKSKMDALQSEKSFSQKKLFQSDFDEQLLI